MYVFDCLPSTKRQTEILVNAFQDLLFQYDKFDYDAKRNALHILMSLIKNDKI